MNATKTNSGVVIMTEERLLKELYKVQNRVIGWILVGVIIGLVLGWIMGVTIGEMHNGPLSASDLTSSNQRVLEVDRSNLGSAR